MLSLRCLGARGGWGQCSAEARGRRTPSAQAVGRARLARKGLSACPLHGRKGVGCVTCESLLARAYAPNSNLRDWEGSGSGTCLFPVKKKFPGSSGNRIGPSGPLRISSNDRTASGTDGRLHWTRHSVSPQPPLSEPPAMGLHDPEEKRRKKESAFLLSKVSYRPTC